MQNWQLLYLVVILSSSIAAKSSINISIALESGFSMQMLKFGFGI